MVPPRTRKIDSSFPRRVRPNVRRSQLDEEDGPDRDAPDPKRDESVSEETFDPTAAEEIFDPTVAERSSGMSPPPKSKRRGKAPANEGRESASPASSAVSQARDAPPEPARCLMNCALL